MTPKMYSLQSSHYTDWDIPAPELLTTITKTYFAAIKQFKAIYTHLITEKMYHIIHVNINSNTFKERQTISAVKQTELQIRKF